MYAKLEITNKATKRHSGQDEAYSHVDRSAALFLQDLIRGIWQGVDLWLDHAFNIME